MIKNVKLTIENITFTCNGITLNAKYIVIHWHLDFNKNTHNLFLYNSG